MFFVDLQKFWDGAIAVIFAMAGGLARLLHTKGKKRLGLGRIFADMFIAGFVGLMVFLLARASGLTGDWVGFASGMGGWSGTMILGPLLNRAEKALGVKADEEKKGGE